MTKSKPITYSEVGDNYDTKDPVKKLAQDEAKKTSQHLTQKGFHPVEDTRGESAFVWEQGDVFMASVVEGLGTKNLIADKMEKIAGKNYYYIIGHDTVATIINDLITVGAVPLVVHAYWAIEDNNWLADGSRMTEFIRGWKEACDIAGATWGGGETATLKDIVRPETVDLGGSAVGIITPKGRLITDKNLQSGDRILFLRSNGVNANGISLVRAVGNKLQNGFGTKMQDGTMFGDAVLTKTNIYAKLIQDLLDQGIAIHYISNITGHGLRKIMRARGEFTYMIEDIFEPQEIFLFIQEHAQLDDYEMYQTYNMGQDYAIFVPEKDVAKAQEIIRENGFESLNAGYVEKGPRQVIIKSKNLTYKGETLNLR